MVVDLKSRQRLMEDRRMEMIVRGIGDTIKSSLSKTNGSSEEKKHIISLQLDEKNDPSMLEMVDKMGKGLILLYKAIKNIRIDFPPVQEVDGTVRIREMPQVKVRNLDDLEKYFKSLEYRIGQLAQAISMVKKAPPPKIEFPKFDVPDNSKAVIKVLGELEKAISRLEKKEMDFPESIEVSNFPPQIVPTPVTHISINSLNGTVKSTAVMVTTDLTPLPPVALAYRRSLTIYNNSSVTIEIGGSAFTFGNGLPVPAGTYAPSFDAGPSTIVYGRTSSGTADVRVTEISDEDSGR
jgi:hypothetical protein